MEPNRATTSSQLVKAAEQLSLAELDRFAEEITALRARRHASVLSANESKLFGFINQSLSEQERKQLADLHDKRADETLTPGEHQALLALQQKLETLHAERMKALAELAALRGITLTAVIDQFGIQFPDYV